MTRVIVAGASGRTGAPVTAGIVASDDLDLVGARRAEPRGRRAPDATARWPRRSPRCRRTCSSTSRGRSSARSTRWPRWRSGMAVVLGTTGLDAEARERLDAAAHAAELPAFYAPNFALGAVLAMQFAEQAAALFPHVEIVELHSHHKLDAPSGTAEATAERIRAVTGHDVPIHSVRLPGLIAHQETLLGGEGQLLTIRHDATVARGLRAGRAARGAPRARAAAGPDGRAGDVPRGPDPGYDRSVIPTQRQRPEPPAGRICTAMATPFGADGSLDLDASRALARHLVEHGSEGLVLAGTTGEGPTLTDDEKLALFEAVLDEVGSDARVIANTGTYDTAHSVHLTRDARRLGVHGFLAVTPYYNKPPAEGLARHFAAIAAAADGLPVIIYNIPQRVILNLEPDADRAPRARERERGRGQAGDDRSRPGARHPGCRSRALRRQRRPARALPRAGRVGRHLRRLAPRRLRHAAHVRARRGRRLRGRARARPRADARSTRRSPSRRIPSRSRRRSSSSGSAWARPGFRWSRRPTSNAPCCAPPLRREA